MLLRPLRLGRLLDTLPERLTLARQNKLGHHDFLELVLADEVSRRATAGPRSCGPAQLASIQRCG